MYSKSYPPFFFSSRTPTSPDEEINDEEINDEEIIDDDVVIDPPTENEKVNNDDPNIPVEEPKVGKPKIPMKMVRNPDGKWTIKKASEKKVKNFSCKICANKKFTTKISIFFTINNTINFTSNFTITIR